MLRKSEARNMGLDETQEDTIVVQRSALRGDDRVSQGGIRTTPRSLGAGGKVFNPSSGGSPGGGNMNSMTSSGTPTSYTFPAAFDSKRTDDMDLRPMTGGNKKRKKRFFGGLLKWLRSCVNPGFRDNREYLDTPIPNSELQELGVLGSSHQETLRQVDLRSAPSVSYYSQPQPPESKSSQRPAVNATTAAAAAPMPLQQSSSASSSSVTVGGGASALIASVGRDGKPAAAVPTSSPVQTPTSRPSGFLLPPQKDDRICLVLDLDETLVHSSFKPVVGADFVVPVEIEGQVHKVYVCKRPGVDEFLDAVGPLFEVVVFTASLNKYADPVLDLLDRNHNVHFRLFREACHQYTGNYVKDLTHLGRDLRKVIIIDNSPSSYIFQPKNAVACTSWFDDPHDRELFGFIPLMEEIASVDNIYTKLSEPSYHRRMQMVRNGELPARTSVVPSSASPAPPTRTAPSPNSRQYTAQTPSYNRLGSNNPVGSSSALGSRGLSPSTKPRPAGGSPASNWDPKNGIGSPRSTYRPMFSQGNVRPPY